MYFASVQIKTTSEGQKEDEKKQEWDADTAK